MGKKITRKEFEERVRIASDDTIDVSEFDFQKNRVGVYVSVKYVDISGKQKHILYYKGIDVVSAIINEIVGVG